MKINNKMISQLIKSKCLFQVTSDHEGHVMFEVGSVLSPGLTGNENSPDPLVTTVSCPGGGNCVPGTIMTIDVGYYAETYTGGGPMGLSPPLGGFQIPTGTETPPGKKIISPLAMEKFLYTPLGYY